jgi:hypothetical protein
MKPSRRLTPIALTPLLVFAGSKYQQVQSPKSYSVGTIEGAAPLAFVQECSRSPP